MSRKQMGVRLISVANKNTVFAMLVGVTKQWRKSFKDFDGFVVLTSRSDAYISRSGDFCVDRPTNKPIALPLAARGVTTRIVGHSLKEAGIMVSTCSRLQTQLVMSSFQNAVVCSYNKNTVLASLLFGSFTLIAESCSSCWYCSHQNGCL